jgi:hypothetical protein
MAEVNYAGLLGDLVSAGLSTQANKQYQRTQNDLRSQLQDTYTNPQGVYNGQYGALDKTFYKDMQAQNAAKGRSTDAYRTGIAREAAFQKWLGDYRRGISNEMQTAANVQPSVSKYSKYSPVFAAAAKMLGDEVDPRTGQKKQSSSAGALNTGMGNLYESLFGPSAYQPQSQPAMNNYVNNQSYEASPDVYNYSGTPSQSAQNEYSNLDFSTDEDFQTRDQNYDYDPSQYSTVDNNVSNNYSNNYLQGTGLDTMFSNFNSGNSGGSYF